MQPLLKRIHYEKLEIYISTVFKNIFAKYEIPCKIDEYYRTQRSGVNKKHFHFFEKKVWVELSCYWTKKFVHCF